MPQSTCETNVVRRSRAIVLAAGAVALMSAASAHSSPAAAAPDVAEPHAGQGRAEGAEQSANSAEPRARDDLRVCAKGARPHQAALAAPRDASVADLAGLLHGTWLRRLTVAGEPVETNSFLYFDMSGPEAGKGQALMIDRINQGWDDLASVTGWVAPKAKPGSPGEVEAAATTGAYWLVSIEPAKADAASRGHSGVAMALAGDYRGNGDELSRKGFRFTETGTFYRDGAAYVTVQPWRAPPMAAAGDAAAPTPPAEPFTPVDAVVVRAGTGGGAGDVMPANDSMRAEPDEAAWPTLTFVVCDGDIVDRYHKIDGATPTVEGRRLSAAWDAVLESGLLQTQPTP